MNPLAKNFRARDGATVFGLGGHAELSLRLCLTLLTAFLSLPALSQDTNSATPEAQVTNAPVQPPDAAPKEPNSPAVASATTTNANTNSTNTNSSAKSGNTNEIQLSFQGANIDMIAQWLAQTTGKSVIKHPQVQCQLTIMSSKKITHREAIDLVYRALSLEGFSAIESASSILIVPEGKEPKMNPELVDASRTDIPEGRQRLVKLFPLANVQAADLRDKLRDVLSDKGTIDVDDRANQLIVSDYNDNLRLLAELIKDFDVPASGLTIQIFNLKHADAEELGNLVGLILNAQAAPAGSSSRSSSSSRTSGMPPGVSFPGGGPSPSDSGGSSPPPSSSGSQSQPQQVRIWPDRASNRLIVSAPKSRMVEVERLLLVLDTDKSEDVAVRIIPLKNVNAADLVKEIGPLYQHLGGKSAKENIEIAANDRSNSLIILSSEANFHALEKLVAGLDTEDAMEKVIRTFPLKNADAEDVAKQLQDLNRDQDNNSRYPYYIFTSSRNTPSRKLSVVSDRRRNSLIVQAPPAQMESVAKMIEELDAPVADDSLAPRIYHLKYVSAVDLEDVLNELFLKKTQQRSYWDFFNDDSGSTTPDRDVGRLYGKVRITSEPYSNSLIITSNSKESLAVLEGVLKELDAPSEAGESTLRIQLRFGKAPDVANSINILFAKNGSPPLRPVNPQQQQQQPNQQQNQQQQSSQNSYQNSFTLEQETKEEGYYPWLGGQPDSPRTSDGRNPNRPVSDLVGRVRAVADPRSNALLLSANVHFFPQVMKLIEDLDAPTAQVLIDARIVEVSSDFLDKLGVRWSPDGSKVFTTDDYDNSLLIHANNEYQKGYGGTTTVNGPPTLGSALTAMRSGVLATTINMDFLIQFLRRTTAARVLAEPQVNIADNERGQLFVGQQIPFIDKSQTTDVGALNQTFDYKPVGVVLEVTPHINNDGDVALRIHAESSAVVPGQVILGGAVIDTRYFRTDLKAHTGETLVLGGMIQKQSTDTIHKIPILGDIPFLGWVFKKKDKTSNEVELMVFLRPKVTRTPKEARELLDEINRSAPNIRKWKEENEKKQGQTSTETQQGNS